MSRELMFAIGSKVKSHILGECEIVETVTKAKKTVAILSHVGGFWVTWNDGYWCTGNFGMDKTLEEARETARHYLACGYGS